MTEQQEEKQNNKPTKSTNAVTHLFNALLFLGIGGATLHYAHNVGKMTEEAEVEVNKQQIQQQLLEKLEKQKQVLEQQIEQAEQEKQGEQNSSKTEEANKADERESEKVNEGEDDASLSSTLEKRVSKEMYELAVKVEGHTQNVLHCEKDPILGGKDAEATLKKVEQLFKNDEVLGELTIIDASQVRECQTEKGKYLIVEAGDDSIVKTAESAIKKAERYIYMPVTLFLDEKPLFTVFHKADLFERDIKNERRIWKQSWWVDHENNTKIDFGERKEAGNPRTFK